MYEQLTYACFSVLQSALITWNDPTIIIPRTINMARINDTRLVHLTSNMVR